MKIGNSRRYTLFFMLLLLGFIGENFRSAATIKDTVIVIPKQISVPAGAKLLGTIKVGDNALTIKCDYESDIDHAKELARKMGGNLVKITQLVSPVFIGSCYRIQAEVYSVDVLPVYETKSAIAAKVEDTNINYATLYIYRLRDTLALEPSYSLHLNNDSVICNVKKRSRSIVKLMAPATIDLWAKTGQRYDLKLDIKPGGTYFIRCALKHGDMRLMPFIEVVNDQVGEKEYGKKTRTDASAQLEYLKQVH
jgi:hypothetical protein